MKVSHNVPDDAMAKAFLSNAIWHLMIGSPRIPTNGDREAAILINNIRQQIGAPQCNAQNK